MTIPIPYTERYRPRYHFSAKENWLNDPNGCVYHDGEYHLFFQHNPEGLRWGNMTWGHAVSQDLIHWRQLPHALSPYDGGTIFSGTAVVDLKNTSGFGVDGKPPLVAAFTHARKPFGQALAYSTDNGRTWKLYNEGKHVVPNQGFGDAERDPKVFWHEPSGKWIMIICVREGWARFLGSEDLKHWTVLSDFFGEGFYDCPDMFVLPLEGEGEGDEEKWVLTDGAGNCWFGWFDGTEFRPDIGPMRFDLGASFYAGQTWSNTGARVVQIGWMRGGKYPGMPFTHQMSIPCELRLRKTPQGVRLCRIPVQELEILRTESHSISDQALYIGRHLPIGKPGDLLDIEMEAEIHPNSRFYITIHNHGISYSDNRIRCLDKQGFLPPVDGKIKLRILVDRTSLEVFGNDGAVCMSSCFLPQEEETPVDIDVEDGEVRITSMTVHRLASAWNHHQEEPSPEGAE